MKRKFLILVALTCVVAAIAQRGVHSPQQRSASIFKSVNLASFTVDSVQVFTNESDFLAAVGTDYYLENFDTCKISAQPNKYTLSYDSGKYSYNLIAARGLYTLNGSMSTAGSNDSMYVVNTGSHINYFGAYFFSTSESGSYTYDTLTVSIGNKSYTISPTDSVTFIGFLINDTIPYFSVVNKDTLFTTIDHVYVGYKSTTTGIATAQASTSVHVYPNPVADTFTLSGVENKSTLVLTDVSGKTLIHKTVNNGQSIPVASLPTGLYTLTVTSPGGTVTRQKLIKK